MSAHQEILLSVDSPTNVEAAVLVGKDDRNKVPRQLITRSST